MNIQKDDLKKHIWLAPPIIAFLLVLIPTLKYPWPLSWDVIYHVVLADVYAKYGLVFTNPLINVPYGGSIGYPPLFHLIIAGLGTLFNMDFFQVARFLQPFLVMFLVLSVTYVGRKFYGIIAGVSAGFLVLSSLLLGTRLIYPLPENMALIFLPLAVYFYYHSMKENSYKYAILTGLLFILTLLIHQAVPIILFLLITVFTLVELFLYRDIKVIKNFGAFLIFPVLALIVGVVVLSIVQPTTANSLLSNVYMEISQIILSNSRNQPLTLLSYGKLGILTGIFAIIGAIAALKRRKKEDIFIFTWIILVLLLINANLFGVDIISFRLLTYLLIPVSILGGFGLSEVYYKLKDYERFSSQNFRSAFLLSMFALATFSGLVVMDNPQIAYNAITNQYGTFQIAIPTDSMVDLANWFNLNGNRSKSILTNNPFVGTFITAETGMPLSGDDFGEFTNQSTLENYFKQISIGYIVLDKRLTFKSGNGTFYRVKYDGAMYPLFYYSGDLKSNLTEVLPDFVTVAYENKDFIVCEIS